MSDIVTELNKVAAKVGGGTNANTIKDAISNISVGLGGDGSATDISDALSDVVQVASAGGGPGNGSDKVPEGSTLVCDYFNYTLDHKLIDGDDYTEFVDGKPKSSGKITWVYSSEGTEGIEYILGTYPIQEDTIVNFGSPYLPESSLRSNEEYKNKRLSIWIGKKFAPVMELSYYAEKGQVSDGNSTRILFRLPYSKMPPEFVDETKAIIGYMSNPEDFVGKTVELISPYTGTKIDDNNCYAEHVDLGTFSYESANGSETYHLGSGITVTQAVINGEGSGNLTVNVSQEIKDLLYSKEPVHNVPTDWTICIRRY